MIFKLKVDTFEKHVGETKVRHEMSIWERKKGNGTSIKNVIM
jgi:hypothetical protein